jgi:hypothetical protein
MQNDRLDRIHFLRDSPLHEGSVARRRQKSVNRDGKALTVF